MEFISQDVNLRSCKLDFFNADLDFTASCLQ